MSRGLTFLLHIPESKRASHPNTRTSHLSRVYIHTYIYIYIYINKHTTPFPFHNSGIYFSVSHFSQVAHFSPKKEKQALLSQLFSLPLEPALLLCLVPFLFLILIAFFHFFLYATYVSERVIFFELLC